MTKLPDSVGDLIRLAIKDLETCEANPEYEIDMKDWHHYDEGTNKCYVCLAGSVMAQSLNTWSKVTVTRRHFQAEIDDKLNMLDVCRDLTPHISVSGYDQRSYLYTNYVDMMESGEVFEVANYKENPRQFKRDMLQLADLMDRYNVYYIGA